VQNQRVTQTQVGKLGFGQRISVGTALVDAVMDDVNIAYAEQIANLLRGELGRADDGARASRALSRPAGKRALIGKPQWGQVMDCQYLTVT
jgi:hypothetical protein